ncbi:DUF2599 domain-containing protein [Cellulomonas sp. SG140]|uniref:DUF2599 domain-containing protein n=1 Tax=Cellulomonas sp. SG140 TaxID=2976536 RepID=UPI0021E8F412|nr:DUF2599 domain-containing protein [Cellulomonas sp. SG140]
MSSHRGPSTDGRRRVRAGRAFALVCVLVGVASACTAGDTSRPAAARPTASTAAPAPTDPSAADVRTRGLAVTANGVSAAAVPDASVTADASADPDGSAHLHLVVRGGGESGAPTSTPASPAASAPPAVPLAWLTGPAGSTAAVLEDGSAVVSASDGSFLLGLSAPTPSARFTVVGTPAAVLRIDRVTGSGLGVTAPDGPVTTWLSGTAVLAASWGEAEGGRSLEITPSEWARSGTLAAQQALWSQLVAQHPDANSPTMHEQLLCHVLGAAGKSTWHIEPWRPQVDALTMLRTRCNPTAADVVTPPAPTAAG